MKTSASRSMCGWGSLWAFIPLTFVLLSQGAYSQCDSVAQRFINEYGISNGGKIINPLWRFAGFEYAMSYDSCEISLEYSEAYLNTERLIWQNWCRDSVHTSWEDSVHGYMSCTRPMKLHTGDTIKLYRDLFWKNSLTSIIDTNNYYAKDTLGFNVELVDTTTHLRVALLDSLLIKSRFTYGRPEMYSLPVNNPIARLMRYGVPSALNNTVVVLRIRPIVRGMGSNYLVRRDIAPLSPSAKLCGDPVIDYLQTALGFPVDTSICFSDARVDSAFTLTLHTADTTGHTIHIVYTGAGNDRLTTISIFRAMGNTMVVDSVHLVLESRSATGSASLNYTLPDFGEYVAFLQYNRNQVAIVRFELDSAGYSQLN